MQNLQDSFSQWAKERNVESNITFKPEQILAFSRGKKIQIKSDESELIITPTDKGLTVKLIQDSNLLKDRLTTKDFEELNTPDQTVSKINSYVGTIVDIKDNIYTVENEEHGKQEFKALPNDFKIGDKIEATASILTKEDEVKGNYKVERFNIKEATNLSKNSFSLYEKEGKYIHHINPKEVVDNINKINNHTLTEEQKNRLIRGKKIDLEDEEEISLSPKSKNGIDAKKVLMLVLGMISPVLFIAIKSYQYKKTKDKKKTEKEIANIKTMLAKELKNNPKNEQFLKEAEKFDKAISKEEALSKEFSNITVEAYSQDNKAIGKFVLNKEKYNEALQVVKDAEKGENVPTHKFDEAKEVIKNVENVNLKQFIKDDNLVSFQIKSASNKIISEFKFDKNSPFLEDNELLKSFFNSKNNRLFPNQNLTEKQLDDNVQKIEDIITQKKFNINTNSFKSYLESMKSMAIDRSEAYPQNKEIEGHINTLSKGINSINLAPQNAPKPNQEKMANVNDKDVWEDAKKEKLEIKIDENKTHKRERKLKIKF